jgi:hypothetical protein
MKWCKEDIDQVHEMMKRGYRVSPGIDVKRIRYPLYIISWTYSISSLHHVMDLLDILFTSFHGLPRYPLYIISWTCSISSLHHLMDLLDILFTSFHGLIRYPLYIMSWTCSIFSLHHFMDLLDILFSSFHGLGRYHLYIPWNDVKRISSKSMKWCKQDIELVHEMMQRGYRISPWNDVKRISSSISSLHHFMD